MLNKQEIKLLIKTVDFYLMEQSFPKDGYLKRDLENLNKKLGDIFEV